MRSMCRRCERIVPTHSSRGAAIDLSPRREPSGERTERRVSAAERRQIVAHGASHGSRTTRARASSRGAATDRIDTRCAVVAPRLEIIVRTPSHPTTHVVGYALSPLRGWKQLVRIRRPSHSRRGLRSAAAARLNTGEDSDGGKPLPHAAAEPLGLQWRCGAAF